MEKIKKECWDLVFEFYEGDEKKTELWFSTPNPALGNICADTAFKIGRGQKVLDFIKASLDEN